MSDCKHNKCFSLKVPIYTHMYSSMYQQKVCVTVPTNVSEKRLSCFPHSSTLDLMGPTCREPAMVEIFTYKRMGEMFTCTEIHVMMVVSAEKDLPK